MFKSTMKFSKSATAVCVAMLIGLTTGCGGTGTDTYGFNESSLDPSQQTSNNTTTGSNVQVVTLNWQKPTLNTDGTDLSDLSGYRIYYGTSPAQISSNSVFINDPALSSYVINNLTLNSTYYFVITSVNSQNVESNYSNIVSKYISG